MSVNKQQTRKLLQTTAVIAGIFILLLLIQPFYVLQEGQTAIITQFGEIVTTETAAGLHLKIPFLHQVHHYTAKLLRIDGDPQKILTKEKQFIEVNTTSRWHISDIRKFYQSLVTYESAYSRLSDIVDSSVRDIITVNSLDDVVRTTNSINETAHTEQFGLNTDEVKLEDVTGAEKVIYAAIEKGRDVLESDCPDVPFNRRREKGGMARQVGKREKEHFIQGLFGGGKNKGNGRRTGNSGICRFLRQVSGVLQFLEKLGSVSKCAAEYRKNLIDRYGIFSVFIQALTAAAQTRYIREKR